ncbi:MAG: DNA-binding protein [Anaerolineales bacterium]|nr:DNA-binding protein [Anaerolineales bacterium]
METYAFRLRPGQDLKAELDSFAVRHDLEAACVLASVGSLTRAVLRFANQPKATILEGYFEIVALTGTLARHGSHIHIAISDGEGRTYGAHLMDGSRVYTTAEIVIGVVPGVRFLRTPDLDTGYDELDIQTHA